MFQAEIQSHHWFKLDEKSNEKLKFLIFKNSKKILNIIVLVSNWYQ